MKIGFVSLGCPKNLVDTEVMMGNIASAGHSLTASPEDADVIVVNTHLYGAHLASGGAVLPEHRVVVFDEAHELEDVLTESLGVDVGPGRFTALAQSARPVVDGTTTEGTSSAASAVASVAEVGDLLSRVLRPWAGKRVPSEVLADGGGVDLGADPASGGAQVGSVATTSAEVP